MSLLTLTRGRLGRGDPGLGSLLFDDDFSSGLLNKTVNGVTYWSGLAGTTNASVVAASSASLPGGGNVCRINYSNATAGGGAARQLSIGPFPQTTDLCIEWDMWIPDTFVVTGTSNMKFARAWATSYNNDAGAAGESSLKMGHDTWGIAGEHRLDPSSRRYNPGGSPEYGAQGPIPTRVAPQGPNLWTNTSYRGQWINVRIRYNVATIANNDGRARLWLAGALVRDDNQLQNYNPYGQNNLEYLYILGASNNAHPDNSFIYLRNVKVSSGGFLS